MDPITNSEWMDGLTKESSWNAAAIGAGLGGVGLGALGYARHKTDHMDPHARSKMERAAQQELRLLDAAVDPVTGSTSKLDGIKRKWAVERLKGVRQAKSRPGTAAIPWGLAGIVGGGIAGRKAAPLIRRLLTKHAAVSDKAILATLAAGAMSIGGIVGRTTKKHVDKSSREAVREALQGARRQLRRRTMQAGGGGLVLGGSSVALAKHAAKQKPDRVRRALSGAALGAGSANVGASLAALIGALRGKRPNLKVMAQIVAAGGALGAVGGQAMPIMRNEDSGKLGLRRATKGRRAGKLVLARKKERI